MLLKGANTLKERVAVQPLEPYEEFWDEATKTGFSERYLVDKLEEAIEDVFEERRGKIEDRVEREIQPKVDRKVSEVLVTLEEIRTKSRVD